MRGWAAILFFLLSLAAGCAEAPAGEDEVLERRFTARPVQLVASSDFSGECVTAIAAAADFWRARNVTMTLRVADPFTTPALSGIAQSGVVAIQPDGMRMVGDNVVALGEARVALTIGGQIFGAELMIGDCQPRVVSHEIGHALGLVHLRHVANLMHPLFESGGWELTGDQLAWAAD